MNIRKGFTLIELIIAIAMGLIVMVTSYNILFTGVIGHSSTLKSFKNQSDVRYAIETTNNAIRFATVGFAVTKDDFKPKLENGELKGLVKPWNYIGLGPDKKSIVHYKYVPTDDKIGRYKMDILAEGLDNLTYDIKFTKPTPTQEDKLIKYILKIGGNGKEHSIATEVDALNAINTIDWGDAKNPAIALAYRTEETPEINKKPIGAILMVLDTSGSMKWGMNGEGTTIKSDTNPERLSLLKNTLKNPNEGLFSIFKDSDVYVSLVPFSYNANIPNKNYTSKDVKGINLSKFYNVKNEKPTLEIMVNALNSEGATNTGDGMRRAYYQLEDFDKEKNSVYKIDANQNIKNYMIVLVDGVTTVGSRYVNIRKNNSYGYYLNFYRGPENLGIYYTTTPSFYSSYGQWLAGQHPSGYSYSLLNQIHSVGDGAKLDKTHGEDYVEEIGNMIQDSKIIDQAFVIGYSNATKKINGKDVYYELESLSNIAKSLGIKVEDREVAEKFINNDFVFVATDKESLKEAFNNIGGYINEELWQIEGPRLKP